MEKSALEISGGFYFKNAYALNYIKTNPPADLHHTYSLFTITYSLKTPVAYIMPPGFYHSSSSSISFTTTSISTTRLSSVSVTVTSRFS